MADALPIAIVDDDDSVLKALRRLLTASGFDTCAFHSGLEFLDSLAEHPVACVLLDIRMPGLDGFAVAHRLAERIPTVFMSAHDSESNRRQAEQQGATAFLCKPATEKKILAAIRRAIASGGISGDEETNKTKVL
jgi:FixJ family two-component response regulator